MNSVGFSLPRKAYFRRGPHAGVSASGRSSVDCRKVELIGRQPAACVGVSTAGWEGLVAAAAAGASYWLYSSLTCLTLFPRQLYT